MEDLISEIRRALPLTLNPEFADDIVSDIAILVLEGRIERERLHEDIRRFLPEIRKKYSGEFLSLDDPLGDEANARTRAETIESPASVIPNCARPRCRNPVKQRGRETGWKSRLYCSRECACKHMAAKRRQIDPKELDHLHNVRHLPRKKTAEILGVTVHGVNNVVMRKGLSREKLPDTCRVFECPEPAVHFRHRSGWLAGNLCKKHKSEKGKQYTRAYKLRKGWKPKTKEERAKQAGDAGMARWAQTADVRAQKKASRRDEIEARKKAQSERTHCANGHPWTPETTYIKKSGGKGCRVCGKLAMRKHRAK